MKTIKSILATNLVLMLVFILGSSGIMHLPHISYAAELAPDLIIQDITWSPANPSAGDTVTFTITVKNQGSGRADASHVAYYIDGAYLSSINVNPINAGAKNDQTFTWTAEAGSHEIKAVADSKNEVIENNETNNEKTFAFSILAPDLIIQDITWSPVNPSVGDTVTFTIAVKNQGNSIARSSQVSFYIGGNYRAEYNVNVQSIDAGAIATTTLTWTTRVGSYEIKAIADSYSWVTESNETNNEKTITFSTFAPDLIAQNITWSPANPSAGDEVTLTITIKNQGGRADGSHAACYIDDEYLSSVYVNPIDAGATNDQTLTWIAEAGSHDIRIVADCNNEVIENNETNNEKTFAFSTLAPDLIIQDITWSPLNPSAGDDVTFTITIKNQGSGRADAFRVVYYIEGSSTRYHDFQAIEPGATETKTLVWTAEATSHEIKAVADPDEAVTESNETNNKKTVTVSTLAPDIAVRNITWSPENPSAGDEVTFTVTINNLGSGRADAFRIAYYIDGAYLSSVYVNSIGAIVSITKTFNWTVELGSHEIKVVADCRNEVIENNETNNEKTLAFSSCTPDLIIQDITWLPVNPSAGDTVTFTATIKNQGSGKADASNVAYYIDTSSRGYNDVQEIAADASVTKTFTWTAEAGSHEIKIVADPDETVIESDETNNEKIAILPPPDFIIQDLKWSPLNPLAGDTVTFTATIKNQGSGKVYTSDVAYYIDDVYLSSASLSPIDVGTTNDQTFTWTAEAGSHEIKIVADPDETVIESDETNNEKTMTVSTRAPDLIIQNITWSPANPSAGDTVTFTATIKNQGSVKVDASEVAYYIDDEYLSSASLNPIDVGATNDQTFTWTAEAGSHEIKIVTDPDETVIESDETNNTQHQSLALIKEASIQDNTDETTSAHTPAKSGGLVFWAILLVALASGIVVIIIAVKKK